MIDTIGTEVSKLKYFDFCEVEIDKTPVMISRTGYTGELGFEIYVPEEKAENVWDQLIKVGSKYGIKPVGLGAALTLRLEKGYLLWGREIGDTTTPLEAGLGWTVRFTKKGDFIGREALEKQKEEGVRRQVTGFMMEDKHVKAPLGSPIKGSPIVAEGKTVGHVTSAGFSYRLDESIGIGHIDSLYRDVGTALEIHVDGMRYMAKVVELPLYDPKGEKLKAKI
jgi:aminomethyltransferase